MWMRPSWDSQYTQTETERAKTPYYTLHSSHSPDTMYMYASCNQNRIHRISRRCIHLATCDTYGMHQLGLIKACVECLCSVWDGMTMWLRHGTWISSRPLPPELQLEPLVVPLAAERSILNRRRTLAW